MIAARGRSWQPPEIGALLRRKTDGTIWRVANIYRTDRQVSLVNTDDDRRRAFPFVEDLVRDFEAVS